MLNEKYQALKLCIILPQGIQNRQSKETITKFCNHEKNSETNAYFLKDTFNMRKKKS